MERIIKRSASMAKYQSSGEFVIKINFDFNQEDLARVRGLSVRYFHSDGKYWTTPLLKDTVEKLISWGYDLDPRLKEFLHPQKEETTLPLKEIEIPGLRGKLFPFQNEGVAFLESRRGRALIADEMGLGKTVQALAYLQLHPELRPAIVVCPASLKLNWSKEAYNWMAHPEVQILSGRTINTQIRGKVIIVNYDVLDAWLPAIARSHPMIAITDECHLYKSNSAQRTKAVKKLAKIVGHFIALSGTPIVNRPIEIFNAVNIINPQAIPPYWVYVKRYCNASYNGFGWDMNGASNTQELHDILIRSVMIRRLKKDVLKDLPDKIYNFVPMELSNNSDYSKAENNFINFIRETKGQMAALKASNAEVLTQIETLKQIAVQGKLKQAIEWIENFLYGNGKLVVFAVHKFAIEELVKAFPDVAVKIDGSTSMSDRDKAVTEFQTNDKIRLFIGNIQAAGVGLTLTAASNVAFLELPWTPGALSQASDRVHRIGQKESVTIHYLLAANTIEERIAKLIDHKMKILASVLDGAEVDQDSLLSELINQYQS